MADEKVFSILHQAGLRLTPQRLAICDLLTTSESHPTANDLYTELKPRFPSLSLATVYNTLDVLVGVGLVNAIGSVGDDRVHFDANLSPHINLACIKCHSIVDVFSDHVQELNSDIGHVSGYQISGSSILYFGTCPQCLSQIR
jgi:Fur family transcriptional regulator, peroxide stress response regulator